MTQRIITGYDDGAGGRDALALGVALADLDPAGELTVARAYAYNPPVEPDVVQGWRRTLRDRAEEELRPAREAYGTRPRTSFTACCGVSPTDALHRLADELDAAAIVVGVSLARGLGRVRVGSTTEQVLHGAPCAVAVAPAGYAERAGRPIARVAVGFNGSDESRRALTSAAAIARDAGARLTVLGVVEQAAVWYAGYAGSDGLAPVGDLVRAELEEAARAVVGVPDVRVRVLTGVPAAAIASATREDDLLVVGSRGYGPLRRVLLGSVSSHVIRDATCPVLVVPRGVGDGDDGGGGTAAGSGADDAQAATVGESPA